MKDYYWLNTKSRAFLERGYLQNGQTPEERIREIAEAAERILRKEGFADKFESYMKKGWISLSTPIWSNFGNKRGLPISCNGSFVDDTMESILYKASEVGMMTKYGAGTSAFFGELRGRGADISIGGKSSGSVHFMELYQSVIDIVSQSNIRRGNFAAYLPIDHPDIEEFISIRDEGHPIQYIFTGVCITDQWMREMIDGDNTKRKLWAKILKKRFESGVPYLFFTDNANNNAPQVYKDKGIKIHCSNMCTEIMLPSSNIWSFVCDLLSLNALHFDDWKNTDLPETATYVLDAVMSEYIEKTRNIPFMEAPHTFAKEHRALGIGLLGWHSYLQSKMIPFESMEAKYLNTEIWKLLKEKTYQASREMAQEYGEPEILRGYGMRNTTTLAIAPTTSSSFILGQVSPSIELLNSNYFVKDLAKGKFTYKNPYLAKTLIKHDKNTKEVWEDILSHGGSVQHLDFLTDHEKNVFKTFGETSQKEIVIQAVQRQKYIDQGQSLNLMIHPDTSVKDVNKLLIFGWENGIKSFYYQRGTNPSQELTRNLLSCPSCEA
jgi:ribonucleoside-diphosphate reductase alpha chain